MTPEQMIMVQDPALRALVNGAIGSGHRWWACRWCGLVALLPLASCAGDEEDTARAHLRSCCYRPASEAPRAARRRGWVSRLVSRLASRGA